MSATVQYVKCHENHIHKLAREKRARGYRSLDRSPYSIIQISKYRNGPEQFFNC